MSSTRPPSAELGPCLTLAIPQRPSRSLQSPTLPKHFYVPGLHETSRLPADRGHYQLAQHGQFQTLVYPGNEAIAKFLASRPSHGPLIGQILSTAISGNDLSSSILYVSGLCALRAGYLAPVALLVVVIILYFFRRIYGEAVTSLPLNGGTYNLLLNTTDKNWASLAGALTLLSYVATAVVSASSAASALNALVPVLPVFPFTFVVLGIFCCLSLIGLGESAVVAVLIFILHIATLLILGVTSIVSFSFDQFRHNLQLPFPDQGNFSTALFFGFASGLLGISGYETTANFVESMKTTRTLNQTLRNLWLAALIFNPALIFLSLGIVDLRNVRDFSSVYLVQIASQAGGLWLKLLVGIDSTIVLSGAVLTGYTGVEGLTRRLALDRLLPSILLAQNRLRGTCHVIFIAFFCVTSLIYAVLLGNIQSLANVYTLAFLIVISLFAVGDLLLKYKRGPLVAVQEVRAPVWTVVLALAGIVVGLVGNLILSAQSIGVFLLYLAVTLLIVGLMVTRGTFLAIMIRTLVPASERFRFFKRVHDWLVKLWQSIMGHPVIFFTSGDQIWRLNKAVGYIRRNELCSWVKFVHFISSEDHDTGTPGASSEAATPARTLPGSPAGSLEGLSTAGQPFASTAVPSAHLATPSTASLPLSEAGPFVSRPRLHIPHQLGPPRDEEVIPVVHSAEQELGLAASAEPEPVTEARPRPIQHTDLLVDLTSVPLDRAFDAPRAPYLPSVTHTLGVTYPALRIDCCYVYGSFTPNTVAWVADTLNVPLNFCFIACPSHMFPTSLSKLGGVRMITNFVSNPPTTDIYDPAHDRAASPIPHPASSYQLDQPSATADLDVQSADDPEQNSAYGDLSSGDTDLSAGPHTPAHPEAHPLSSSD